MISVMDACPTLHTERLLLRPFKAADADTVYRLAGVKEVAAGTLLPHPYDLEAAAQWIAQQQESFAASNAITFAIVLAEEELLIGSIGMEIAHEHQLARLSYWLGTNYWNQGYCTEAVRAVLDYGFTRLSLHRIYAPHFHNNPCLLYTSDAADERSSVDLGGRRIIKKKKQHGVLQTPHIPYTERTNYTP